jgi:hypothetical protein
MDLNVISAIHLPPRRTHARTRAGFADCAHFYSRHACTGGSVSRMLPVILACSTSWQPQPRLTLWPAQSRALARMQPAVMQERRKTLAEQQADKAAAKAALERANEKLEELNKVEKLAPTSWADLGVPPEKEQDNPMMGAISVAPLVVGAFSLGLYLLNGFGAFGEGPDLDALVEEWSKL